MKRADPDRDAEDERLEAAWRALEAGEAEQCLDLLDACDPEEPARHVIACHACLDLGEIVDARDELGAARRLGLAIDDPDYLSARGELELVDWRIADARATFEALARVERTAYALERLSLCADLAEEFERADSLLEEAHRLDPEAVPELRRFSADEFGRVIQRALAELRPEHKAVLENTPVLVEPVPYRELAPEGDPLSVPAEALGLFVGPSLVDEADGASGQEPPAIYLFQRNLERYARDEKELIEEIRITLFHEIGHRLGYDEAGVDDLGLA